MHIFTFPTKKLIPDYFRNQLHRFSKDSDLLAVYPEFPLVPETCLAPVDGLDLPVAYPEFLTEVSSESRPVVDSVRVLGLHSDFSS